MDINFDYINELKRALDANKDKRVCVVGTTCTGKSTYLSHDPSGYDMDEIIFKLLTPEETAYVNQTPWTPEIGETMDRLVRERIKIEPGHPVFGTVIIDCDLIVYLDISDELLRKRTTARNAKFEDAKNMKDSIEQALQDTDIECIRIPVEERDIER